MDGVRVRLEEIIKNIGIGKLNIKIMELKVFQTCCQNCLLSKDRIVSPQKAKNLVKECLNEEAYFICHKASINNQEVVCHKFYTKFGNLSRIIRLAQSFGLIKMVEQESSKKLPTYNQMYPKK